MKKNFCFYLQVDFLVTVLFQIEQHFFLIYLSKGKNKEVHKSQISSGVSDNCAEPMAMPRRGQFCLPGLLLLPGGRLSSLQALHMNLSQSQSHSGCLVMFWGWFASFWWHVMHIQCYISDTGLPLLFIKDPCLLLRRVRYNYIFQLEQRSFLVKLASVFSFSAQHDH